MDFRKSLQEQLGQHEPNEVDELILDELFQNVDNFTPEHKKTLEMYNSLVHLSLNNFGLKSLKNFPSLPNLEVLELRENKLTGSDLGDLKTLYPKLRKLKVGANPISTLDSFKILATFPSLKKLELLESTVTNKDTYRDELFKMLQNVVIIDKMDRNGDEIDSTVNEDDEDFEDMEGLEGEDDDDFDDEDDEGFEDEEEEDEEEDLPPRKKPNRE